MTKERVAAPAVLNKQRMAAPSRTGTEIRTTEPLLA